MTAPEKKSKHHLFWPRKKFPDKWHRTKFVLIPYAIHMAYHEYYLHHCRAIKECADGKHCKYEGICCYCPTFHLGGVQ